METKAINDHWPRDQLYLLWKLFDLSKHYPERTMLNLRVKAARFPLNQLDLFLIPYYLHCYLCNSVVKKISVGISYVTFVYAACFEIQPKQYMIAQQI